MKKGIIILVLMVVGLVGSAQTAQENDSLIASVIIKSMNTEPQKWTRVNVNNKGFTNLQIDVFVNISYSDKDNAFRYCNIYSKGKKYEISTFKFAMTIYEAVNDVIVKKDAELAEIKAKKDAEFINYFKDLAKK